MWSLAGYRRRSLTIAGVVVAALALLQTGCATHRELMRQTAAANLTSADIYYQQVLNNVARFVVNPASMPSFSVIASGTVNVEDARDGTVGPTYNPTLSAAQQGGGAFPILSILFAFNTRRSVTENWSTAPVTDSDNLRRMRCAFQYLVGTETSECDQCVERLKGFMRGGTESFECMFPRNWFCVGAKDEVPPQACCVANYGDLYVWVVPEGLDGFTRFSIAILDIATGEIHAPQRTIVKRYRGSPDSGVLESTEITYSETDVEALSSERRFQQDRERPNTSDMNRGLFFVPR